MIKYIPILYQTEMVESIFNDVKKQTRRTKGLDKINSDPRLWNFKGMCHSHIPENYFACFEDPIGTRDFIKCPYGEPGDVLWVRETWNKRNDKGYQIAGERFYYKAGWKNCSESAWKPSIHMPKEACRLFLKIKSIRAERLQNISEDDAKAEGIETKPYGSHPYFCTIDYSRKTYKNGFRPGFCADTGRQFRDSFKTLWTKINGADSWNLNPWVWVIEFEKIDKPENWPL